MGAKIYMVFVFVFLLVFTAGSIVLNVLNLSKDKDSGFPASRKKGNRRKK